jgi:NitT/TauT family transport system substrate-binding protein
MKTENHKRAHMYAGRALALIAALVIAGLAAACGGSGSPGTSSAESSAPAELTPVALQMQIFPEPGWGWHLYGIEHGIYAEHGIDLELITGQGSNFTLQQLNENQVQFGQASLISYLANRAEVGEGTTAVFTPIDHPQAGILTTVAADSLDDMVGKTVAMIPFTVLRSILPIVLQENGLPPDAITIETTQASSPAMLLEGTVDGIEGFLGSNVASSIQTAADAGVELSYLDMNEFGYLGYGHALIVRDETIENDPDLVRRMVTAMRESLIASMEATPEEIADLLTAFAPELSADNIVLDWPDYVELIHESGLIDEAVVETNLGYVTDGLGIPHDLQASEVYTNEFVPTD